MMRTVDLKLDPGLVPAYVAVRNAHARLLLSEAVSLAETERWLREADVEAIALVDGDVFRGAFVLYPAKGGEIAFFTAGPGEGLGVVLLEVAEEAARRRGLAEVWSWVLTDNAPARRCFEKAAFVEGDAEPRMYRGVPRPGVLFRKAIASGEDTLPGTGTIHTQEEYGIRPEAVEFPLMSVLSFVMVCNAVCPNCPYTNSEIRAEYRDAKYMHDDTFKIVADQAGPHGAWLRLSGGGEPMLHPHAVELMGYAKRKGCKIGLITNGSLFGEDASRRLLAAGVDMIEFSVDACDAATYARVRKGLKWQTLLENVGRLVGLRDDARANTKIIASCVNQQGVDVDEVAAFWGPLVDDFQKRKYLTWGINDPDRSADDAPYLPPAERIPCPFLFERLNIDARGKVMVCGFDIRAVTDMGNVHEQSIAEIWKGEGFGRYRLAHLDWRGDDMALCRECPDWQYRSWRHNYWKIVERAEAHREQRVGAEALGFHDIEGCPADDQPGRP